MTTPSLIMITGLPGTGKTTVATRLAQHLSAAHFNTDKIRIALSMQGQYSDAAKARVYDKLLSQSEEALSRGQTVIVDGTFYKQDLRQRFAAMAERLSIQLQWIELRAREAVIKERVNKKRQYSEADFAVYEKIKALYEPLQEKHLTLATDRLTLDEMVEQITNYVQK